MQTCRCLHPRLVLVRGCAVRKTENMTTVQTSRVLPAPRCFVQLPFLLRGAKMTPTRQSSTLAPHALTHAATHGTTSPAVKTTLAAPAAAATAAAAASVAAAAACRAHSWRGAASAGTPGSRCPAPTAAAAAPPPPPPQASPTSPLSPSTPSMPVPASPSRRGWTSWRPPGAGGSQPPQTRLRAPPELLTAACGLLCTQRRAKTTRTQTERETDTHAHTHTHTHTHAHKQRER